MSSIGNPPNLPFALCPLLCDPRQARDRRAALLEVGVNVDDSRQAGIKGPLNRRSNLLDPLDKFAIAAQRPGHLVVASRPQLRANIGTVQLDALQSTVDSPASPIAHPTSRITHHPSRIPHHSSLFTHPLPLRNNKKGQHKVLTPICRFFYGCCDVWRTNPHDTNAA